MVRIVARRVHSLQGPASAFDHVAILCYMVGPEIPVAALFDLRRFLVAMMRAVTVGRCCGLFLHRRRGRGMVAVRVGDDLMGDRLAVEDVQQRRDMLVVERPRIDNGDVTAADDVGAGAHISERAWIVRNDPPDQRGDLLHLAVFELDVFDEGDGHRHMGEPQ